MTVVTDGTEEEEWEEMGKEDKEGSAVVKERLIGRRVKSLIR